MFTLVLIYLKVRDKHVIMSFMIFFKNTELLQKHICVAFAQAS